MNKLNLKGLTLRERAGEKIKAKKKGASHWLEILGAILIVVLLIGAFNGFDYGTVVTKFMNMLTGLLDKAEGLWK